MVDECIHICATGQKCRRIPKRGQKYCAAHRPSRRRRRLFEEDQPFQNSMFAWADRFRVMTLDDLLYAATGALADVHPIIDRRSSRRDRALFIRASTVLGIAADRICEARRAHAANAKIHPQQESSSSQPPAMPVPLTQVQRAQAQAALETLESSPSLSPEQLSNLCNRLLSTLDPDNLTVPTLSSNT